MKIIGFSEISFEEVADKLEEFSKKCDLSVGGNSSLHFFDRFIIKQLKEEETSFYMKYFMEKEEWQIVLVKNAPKVYGLIIDESTRSSFLVMENLIAGLTKVTSIDMKLG